MKTSGKGYGSQYWLRIAVNSAPNVLNREIRQSITLNAGKPIEWISPLAPAYAEYQDHRFVEQLRIKLTKVPLTGFFPMSGLP